MDDFFDKMNIALKKVGDVLVFDELNDEAFSKIEEAVYNEINESVINDPQIRWIEHSVKIARNTFSSTFVVKDNEGEIRKFTISPEINQLKFNDVVEE